MLPVELSNNTRIGPRIVSTRLKRCWQARSQRPSASYLQKLYASVDYLVVLAPPTNVPRRAILANPLGQASFACILRGRVVQ